MGFYEAVIDLALNDNFVTWKSLAAAGIAQRFIGNAKHKAVETGQTNSELYWPDSPAK